MNVYGFKKLWKRFVAAINSVRLPSKIVVAPLEKQRDASTSKNLSHAA